MEESQKLKYRFNRLRTMTSEEVKERVAAKKRKRVKLGDTEFESIIATARHLKCSHSFVTKRIQKGFLPDNTPISFID